MTFPTRVCRRLCPPLPFPLVPVIFEHSRLAGDGGRPTNAARLRLFIPPRIYSRSDFRLRVSRGNVYVNTRDTCVASHSYRCNRNQGREAHGRG